MRLHPGKARFQRSGPNRQKRPARQDGEARRRFRLLERLKQRRLEDWRLAGDKELEELASESYLARWTGRLHAAGE